MQATLFKSSYLPNIDGSESTTKLTNSNTVFIHTYLGDDNTGDGTREKPYRSVAKASLKSGMTYVLFRGLINEAFSTIRVIVGDDVNQVLVSVNYTISTASIFRCTISGDIVVPNGYSIYNVIISGNINSSGSNNPNSYYCLVKGVVIKRGVQDYNDTHIQYVNSATPEQPTNGVIIKYLNLLPNLLLLGKNMVMSSACVYKYNSINILHPNFTGDSKANIELLRNAYIAAGMPSVNALQLFTKDSFSNETYLIIKEARSGGPHPNVFNKYNDNLSGTLTGTITAGQSRASIQLTVADSSKFTATGDIFIPNTTGDGYEVFTYTSITINSDVLITFNGANYTFKASHSNSATCTRYGDVLDFTLNPDPQNEALWASDTGGYVGCFRPAVDGIIDSNATFINVNPDGTDGGVGDLFEIDANEDLVFNGASTQTWNRFRDDSTVVINEGFSFKGLNAMSTDGSPFGFYIGKKQNLIDTTPKYPGDTLVTGQMYKIFNDSGRDVTRSILYNNIQYLPEYTFYAINGVPSFSLLNAGIGTYVKAVNADVIESIELIPYDDIATPSVNFPKFSAPLMGYCKLLFYTAAGATRYGKVSGQPVKFADLALANMITDFPRGLNNMYLTVATTAAAATTITVNDTTNYPSSGVVYFGTTKFTYTSKTATTLVGASQTLTAQPIGTLVNLVNRLDVNTISLYDDYAISNADREFFVLGNPNLPSPLSTYFSTAIPNVRYLRREINGHVDLLYDY